MGTLEIAPLPPITTTPTKQKGTTTTKNRVQQPDGIVKNTITLNNADSEEDEPLSLSIELLVEGDNNRVVSYGGKPCSSSSTHSFCIRVPLKASRDQTTWLRNATSIKISQFGIISGNGKVYSIHVIFLTTHSTTDKQLSTMDTSKNVNVTGLAEIRSRSIGSSFNPKATPTKRVDTEDEEIEEKKKKRKAKEQLYESNKELWAKSILEMMKARSSSGETTPIIKSAEDLAVSDDSNSSSYDSDLYSDQEYDSQGCYKYEDQYDDEDYDSDDNDNSDRDLVRREPKQDNNNNNNSSEDDIKDDIVYNEEDFIDITEETVPTEQQQQEEGASNEMEEFDESELIDAEPVQDQIEEFDESELIDVEPEQKSLEEFNEEDLL